MKKLWQILLIWGSYVSFLALYILQKGVGLVEMEKPFFQGALDRGQVYHSALWVNVVSFAFVTLVFGAMWFTKADKRLAALRCSLEEWVAVLAAALMFALKAGWSYPMPQWAGTLSGAWGLYAVLAAGAIPCMLFVLSWLREKCSGAGEVGLERLLQGKAFFAVCAAVALVGLGMDIACAFSLDMWNDEEYTLDYIERGWLGCIFWSVQDVHPPLYLLLFKGGIAAIRACIPSLHYIYAAKLVAVLPYVVLCGVCLTVVRRKWGNYVAGLGALSVVCMPLMLYSSQEMRMYGWLMLWITCSWLSAHSICRHNRLRDWAGLVIFSLLTAYTHYAACLAPAALWLFMAVWCRQHRCVGKLVAAAAAGFVGYLPWLVIMVKQVYSVGHSYWMPELTPADFLDLLLSPTRDVLIMYVLLVIGALAVAQWRRSRSVFLAHALAGMALVFAVVAVMSAISCFTSPIIATRVRYVVPMLGCLWLGALVAVDALRSARLRLVVALMVLFVSGSEMRSFLRVQAEGRDGAAQLKEFVSLHEPVELVAALSVHKSEDMKYKAFSVRRIAGKQFYQLCVKRPKEMDIEEQTKNAMAAYGLPAFITPLATKVRRAIYEDTRAADARMIVMLEPAQVREMMDAGNTVYCVGVDTVSDRPDWEKTSALLAKAGIVLAPQAALHRICSGCHRVYLYKLAIHDE